MREPTRLVDAPQDAARLERAPDPCAVVIVQLTVAERLGVEGRGAYYDEAGVIRDMVQNHLLQLLCLVAMEPPVAWHARAVRDEKLKVLQAVGPLTPDMVQQWTVRGQYGLGKVDGERVPAYRQEAGVTPDSTTETFAAVKLHLESWWWAAIREQQ